MAVLGHHTRGCKYPTHLARLLKYYPRRPCARPVWSNRDFFLQYLLSYLWNSLYVYTRGILGCLLGFWPLKHLIYHFTSILHGLIRTHKWPAPNVSGFIAQLVRTSHRYRELQNYQQSRNGPYPRRLESLTICRWNYKGSPFLLSCLKTLSVGPVRVSPASQPGAQPSEPPVPGIKHVSNISNTRKTIFIKPRSKVKCDRRSCDCDLSNRNLSPKNFFHFPGLIWLNRA